MRNSSYRIVGTKGQVYVDPAYEYAEGLEYELTIGEKTTRKKIGKRDQFAPELLYFSDCIRHNAFYGFSLPGVAEFQRIRKRQMSMRPTRGWSRRC